MTDIEKKALVLVNEVRAEYGYTVPITYNWFNADSFEHLAFLRAVEQHEAFRQEVSEVCEDVRKHDGLHKLDRFIIAKTDPLVEVIADYKRTKGTGEYATNKDMANAIRAALDARGLEIREKQP